MWNEIALEELDENTNKSTKFCFNKRTKWKYEQKHQIMVESQAGLGFGERTWCWHVHIFSTPYILSPLMMSREYDVENMMLTRDVWKFAKLDSSRRLVQFWQNFQTSLVLLIPNCTRHYMITYTYTPCGCIIGTQL
jgi:hypothetical protein